eukprot:TRINITY_DN2486_c1_g1_i12.p1 TRINITY_DN2486_c1_g1~~TRINITY_DN2486_c1_g1_i12.p1  ORF type:complete len:273 (+),score=25.31 TRINITY_DN2486_c1_g1_i12:119-937(+)
MPRAASPSKSIISLTGDPHTDRAGYFSVLDSSAPKIPSSRRETPAQLAARAQSPGPGHYNTTVEQHTSFGRGGTIGKAGLSRGSSSDLRRVASMSPGPAAYNTSENGWVHGGRSFGTSTRKPLYTGVATGSHVGPGSYNTVESYQSTNSPRRSGLAFSTAGSQRRSIRSAGDVPPGPSDYATVSQSSFSKSAKGGSFSKSSRAVDSHFKSRYDSPSSCHYSNNHSMLSTKGGVMGTAGKTHRRSAPIRNNSSPGPGAYDPLYAVSSGNIKCR